MNLRSALIPALAAALAAALAGSAIAQPAPPLSMNMDYDGTLSPLNITPIKLLSIHSAGHSIPGGYTAESTFRLAGLLSMLKRIDIDAKTQGRLRADGHAYPDTFTFDNFNGKRTKHVQIDWTADDVKVTANPPYGNLGQPPATRAQKLMATDPLTHFVRVAGASGPEEICRGPDYFFDGKQFYSLEFGRPQPAKPSDQMRELGLVNAAQCTVHMTQIAGYKPKKPGEGDGLKGPITMVFAQARAGGPWVVADVNVETVIGRADIVLRKMDVSGQVPKD